MSEIMYNDDPDYKKLIDKNYIWSDQCILGFFKENFWLSNFYEHNKNPLELVCCQDTEVIKNCQDIWHGYPSVENYYQSEKAIDKKGFEQGNLKGEDAYYAFKAEMGECSPDRAKKLGQTIKLREDWEQEKVKVMYHALKEKFNWYLHPILCKKLLNTRDAYLAEVNYWEDHFWGCELVNPYEEADKFSEYPLIKIQLDNPVMYSPKSGVNWRHWLSENREKVYDDGEYINFQLYGYNMLGRLLMKRREELKIEMPEKYLQELSINGLYGIKGFKILKDIKEIQQ